VNDSFDDGILSPDLWEPPVTAPGTSVAERNGRLEVELAPEAAAGNGELAGQLWTKCRFFGDFDLRVEYELLEWPAANGVTVHLAAIFGRDAVDMTRQSQSWGETYSSWSTRSFFGGGGLATRDVRGALRIRRHDGRITTFHRDGNAWGAVIRAAVGDSPRVLLKASSTDERFADQRVRIAFDNLSVTAENKFC
jgi:hypothetical protein